MSDTLQSLDQLSQVKPAAPDAPKYVKKIDKFNRAWFQTYREMAQFLTENNIDHKMVDVMNADTQPQRKVA